MKKTIKALSMSLAAIVMVSAVSVPAMAHGHRKASKLSSYYTLCESRYCTDLGFHRHSGALYCGSVEYHSYEICTVKNCTLLGLHEHDGEYYRCAEAAVKYTGKKHCR